MIIQVRGTNSKTNTNYHHKPHISNKTNKKLVNKGICVRRNRELWLRVKK